MRVRYTRSALADLRALSAYVRQHHPKAAGALGRRIRASVARLAAFPELGRPGRLEGTRELVVPGTPYLVAYRVTGEAVDILAVLHGARRWPEKL